MGSIYIRYLEEGGTREDAAAPPKTTASTAPREELSPPLPGRSPSPPAMGNVGEAADLATSMAALEVLSTAGLTQDPPSSSLVSDEDCFPQGERSEGEDSSHCSSPLRDYRILQTNLQYSQSASATLRRVLENQQGKTIALIQEPWIRGGRICGLGNIGGT